MENSFFKKDGFFFFDGAMGTMVQKSGIKLGELPETLNFSQEELVRSIHAKYAGAGAQALTTNTFGANELKLEGSGLSVEEVIEKGVALARAASKDALVAHDIGPTGAMLAPTGTLTFEEAYEIFARQARAGVKAGADMHIIETVADLNEARAAVLAVKENSDLPVLCTMTFQDDGRTLMGSDPATVALTLGGMGLDAVGLNCSLGPAEMIDFAREFVRYSPVPVIVQPNAGLPKLVNGETVFDMKPGDFAEYMKKMAEIGVRVLGGCCGTSPEIISAMVAECKKVKPILPERESVTAVTSSTRSVILGRGVRAIGERINPTGKKLLKEALMREDYDYLVSEGVSQRDAGADILDVNVGLPEIDEKKAMTTAVKRIQEVVDLPLQVDSTNPEVIEAGVRTFAGKALINSVNGKKSSLETVLPVAKKYGACVLGLTLDDEGIPGNAEKRFEIAGRIVETAEKYGIPKENVLIDCLVLTASAQQAEVAETLRAVRMVKEKLGVATVLGVSNVSFGLPRRDVLNSTFLAMALEAGLDAPILNPLSESMMGTLRAFRVLSNQDPDSTDFLEKYAGSETEKSDHKPTSKKSLGDLVVSGMKKDAVEKTRVLLDSTPPMEIVEKELVPALDRVGDNYEKGVTFLPQLMQSADTVKGAFEIIKAKLAADGDEEVSKGTIILATVRGDVHDIGKNIVKILLENYGFKVVDLGKDVPAAKIVEKASLHKIRLVGLSALMTTTVKSMEETIAALREQGVDCSVMVGGAVITPEYAEMMGADFYAADAREAVNIARKFFEK